MAGSPCLGWAHAARPGQVRRKPRLSPKSRSIGPAQAKGARELADKGLGFADEGAEEPAARDVAVASLMTSEGCRRVRVGSLVAARAVLRRLSSGYVVPFAPASVARSSSDKIGEFADAFAYAVRATNRALDAQYGVRRPLNKRGFSGKEEKSQFSVQTVPLCMGCSSEQLRAAHAPTRSSPMLSPCRAES
jgi:hypothetical protein